MDKEQQLWNEYSILRDEIKSADTIKYQIMGFVVAAAAAILVKGFDQSSLFARSFILMCVYIVTFPGYRLLLANQRRTWRNSTYMCEFIEPQLKHVNWESRLCNIRYGKDDVSAKSVSSLALKNEWFLFFLMNTVASLAAIVTSVQKLIISYKSWVAAGQSYSPYDLWFSCLFILCELAIYILVLKYSLNQEKAIRRGGSVENNFREEWQKIKNGQNITSN